jgi:hypothetical protein
MNAEQSIDACLCAKPRRQRKTSYGLIRTLAIAGRL